SSERDAIADAFWKSRATRYALPASSTAVHSRSKYCVVPRSDGVHDAPWSRVTLTTLPCVPSCVAYATPFAPAAISTSPPLDVDGAVAALHDRPPSVETNACGAPPPASCAAT